MSRFYLFVSQVFIAFFCNTICLCGEQTCDVVGSERGSVEPKFYG